MTSDLQTQVFTTWLPLAIMLVFGVIGTFRGAVREAVLAAMVAIAAFIDTQWAIQWGQSFNDLYKGWPQQGEQFYISLVVLWAVALIIGYGLGSLIPRQPIRPQSRLMGLLLGLLSGGALAGWSLRLYITNTDGTLQPGVLLDSIVSRAFIIWATWFPLVLILLATIIVLVGPLRRMQGAVGEPSQATDWTPNAATRTAAPAGPPASAGYSPTGTAVLAYPPAQPGAAPGVPARAQGGVSSPQVPVAPFAPASNSTSAADKYGTYDNFDSTRTRAFTPQPEPPTTLLPTREASTTTTSIPEESLGSAAQTQHSPDTKNYSTFDSSGSGDSSWLLHAVDNAERDDEAQVEATPVEPHAATAVSEQIAPEAETKPPVASEAETPAEVTVGTATETLCPNCGSPLIPGASFCTNCGTRLIS